MKRIHISDTIATHDTTVERLGLQYKLLNNSLGYQEYDVEFLASEFGNSIHTAQLAFKFMTDHDLQAKEWLIADTICVNNASRAKHKDSGNAKWSWCLRAKVQIIENGHMRDVVWVDDEVFDTMSSYIHKIHKIQGITHGNKTVDDISQWSQFRSLEYWPTAQILVHKYKKNPTELEKHIHMIEHEIDTSIKVKNMDIQEIRKELIHIYIEENDKKLQKIQLVGQFDKYFSDRDIEIDDKMTRVRENLVENSGDDLFARVKKSLTWNQLRVIDKDKFGNIKCMTSGSSWIHDIAKTLEKKIGEHIQLDRKDIDGNLIQDHAYMVTSLSDKTWEKCLRNGSSRWPDKEILVEINISKDETYTKWENLGTLWIWSIITLS